MQLGFRRQISQSSWKCSRPQKYTCLDSFSIQWCEQYCSSSVYYEIVYTVQPTGNLQHCFAGNWQSSNGPVRNLSDTVNLIWEREWLETNYAVVATRVARETLQIWSVSSVLIPPSVANRCTEEQSYSHHYWTGSTELSEVNWLRTISSWVEKKLIPSFDTDKLSEDVTTGNFISEPSKKSCPSRFEAISTELPILYSTMPWKSTGAQKWKWIFSCFFWAPRWQDSCVSRTFLLAKPIRAWNNTDGMQSKKPGH